MEWQKRCAFGGRLAPLEVVKKEICYFSVSCWLLLMLLLWLLGTINTVKRQKKMSSGIQKRPQQQGE
jgi:hypothetical protein